LSSVFRRGDGSSWMIYEGFRGQFMCDHLLILIRRIGLNTSAIRFRHRHSTMGRCESLPSTTCLEEGAAGVCFLHACERCAHTNRHSLVGTLLESIVTSLDSQRRILLTYFPEYMNMNSGSYMTRSFQLGFLLWTLGTIGIRLTGHRILHPNQPLQTMLLYLISFVLMAVVARRICSRLRLEKDSWPRAASLLILPTLTLDPFTCAFFPTVFPNIDPAAAGIFGGWMLICCAGAVAGVWGVEGKRSSSDVKGQK
jgi:uncharacterized protein DUF5367